MNKTKYKPCYLDEVKKSKYSKLTYQEKQKQKKYADRFMAEMMFRKEKGNEKYGNYMMDVDFKKAFKEFEEECMDACNHLIMLSFKLKQSYFRKSTKKKK